jgi:diaminopimelate decarboxylase
MTDLKLTPRKNQVTENLLQEEEKLFELEQAFGSPLNIVLPESIRQNIKEYREVYDKHRISGKIFLAHKANKSEALVKEAEDQGICIDVASKEELKDALKTGFKGDRIECTGPKNLEFLELALKHGCSIHLDSLSELDRIEELYERLDITQKIPVQIRLSGFKPKDRDTMIKDSKFGVHKDRKDEIIEKLKEHEDTADFKALAFHLDTSNIRKKVTALDNLFDMYKDFQEEGVAPEAVNIGGGQRANYLESAKEWSDYKEAIQESLKKDSLSVTWNNQSFGFKVHGEQVVGSANFYNYYNETVKAEYLDELLGRELPSHDQTVAEMLRQYMVKLYIEPGRSLYDQAGVTISRVNFVKSSLKGENLVGLDMNMTNLNTNNWELMTDPVVVQSKDREPFNDGIYFTGDLCLENDMIYNHKTFLESGIGEGDLVIFVNTAAYHMDFGEAKTIQKPVAEKLAVTTENGFKWFRDDKYSPIKVKK